MPYARADATGRSAAVHAVWRLAGWAGVGLVFRARGTTRRDSDIIARFDRAAHRRCSRADDMLGYGNLLVFAAAFFGYGPEKALYALLTGSS